MKTSHINYLKRIIGMAATVRGTASLVDAVSRIKSPDIPVYQMMRDIVCDARFFTVLENELFWKNYSFAVISRFIDSLTPRDWENEELRTIKKEDFLNAWLSRHITPITEAEQRRLEAELRMKAMPAVAVKPQPQPQPLRGDVDMGDGITDKTETHDEIGDRLPPEIAKFANACGEGKEPGMHSDGHKAEAEFMKRLSPDLQELAELIGRKGKEYYRAGKFQSASRSDISGITLGNDLNSMLPSELALLATPEAEKVFLQKYVQKRLQIFSSASCSGKEGKQKAGPIYICVDTSGSMYGKPETMAKSLALAIAIIAQREHRPICMINYSDCLSFFILTDLRAQQKQFLAFLSKSYAGGNNENRLFRFIFERLPSTPRYRQFAERFKGADLLVISDFMWSPIRSEVKQLLDTAHSDGMRFYSLGIDMPGGLKEEAGVSSDSDCFESGYAYYMGSDYRYNYSNGECRIYSPESGGRIKSRHRLKGYPSAKG